MSRSGFTPAPHHNNLWLSSSARFLLFWLHLILVSHFNKKLVKYRIVQKARFPSRGHFRLRFFSSDVAVQLHAETSTTPSKVDSRVFLLWMWLFLFIPDRTLGSKLQRLCSDCKWIGSKWMDESSRVARAWIDFKEYDPFFSVVV